MNAKSTTSIDRDMERDDAPRITDAWAKSAEHRVGDVIIKEANPPVRIGRPPKPIEERKQQVTMRFARDLLEAMRASGPGWQARAEGYLRRLFIEIPEAERELVAHGEVAANVIERDLIKARMGPGKTMAEIAREGKELMQSGERAAGILGSKRELLAEGATRVQILGKGSKLSKLRVSRRIIELDTDPNRFVAWESDDGRVRLTKKKPSRRSKKRA